MEFKDYYQILGVEKNATNKQIKKAYRRLARQHHPDVNPGDDAAEDKFKEINEAHQVLSDPESRRKYDTQDANGQENEWWHQAGGQGQPFDAGSFGFEPRDDGRVKYEHRSVSEEELGDLLGEESQFSDFFARIFGGSTKGTRYQAPRPRRGRDFEYPVQVSLKEAFQGTTRLLQMADKSGALRQVEVKIPSGVTDGSRVRLAGQGEPGSEEGPSGDLYLVIRVLPSPHFQRKGNNLRTRVKVPFLTAVLGGEVEIATLDGNKVALTIPPETQNKQVFRLRGKGMPQIKKTKERGDLLAEIQVVLPQNLSERERELFGELARAREDVPAETVF